MAYLHRVVRKPLPKNAKTEDVVVYLDTEKKRLVTVKAFDIKKEKAYFKEMDSLFDSDKPIDELDKDSTLFESDGIRPIAAPTADPDSLSNSVSDKEIKDDVVNAELTQSKGFKSSLKRKSNSSRAQAPGSRVDNRESPSFRWVGRWTKNANNASYFEDEKRIGIILKTLGCKKFAFQLEMGEQTGLLHWQLYFNLEKKQRSHTLINYFNKEELNGIYLKKAYGTEEQCMSYCSKVETRVKGPFLSSDEKEFIFWDTAMVAKNPYPWQKMLTDMLLCSPRIDNRSITWLSDLDGNTGKSTWARYMSQYHPNEVCLIGHASYNDAAQAINTHIRTKKTYPKIIIFDLSRQMPSTKFKEDLYAGIENIKSGIVFISKYHSLTMVMPQPHVVVLWNNFPEQQRLSSDRFKTFRFSINVKRKDREVILLGRNEILQWNKAKREYNKAIASMLKENKELDAGEVPPFEIPLELFKLMLSNDKRCVEIYNEIKVLNQNELTTEQYDALAALEQKE